MASRRSISRQTPTALIRQMLSCFLQSWSVSVKAEVVAEQRPPQPAYQAGVVAELDPALASALRRHRSERRRQLPTRRQLTVAPRATMLARLETILLLVPCAWARAERVAA